MNDILGNSIRWSRLGAKDQRDGTCRFLSFFDLPVLMYRIKGIQLLPLILMQTLDLDIKDGTNARTLIRKLDRDELLQDLVRQYLSN